MKEKFKMHAAILLFDFLPNSRPLVATPNEPTAPTDKHLSGSSTRLQQKLCATPHTSLMNRVTLTSTPAARGIISQQTASTCKAINPYPDEDLAASSVYLPFDLFLQKVLNLPEDWKSNAEYTTLLGALEVGIAYGHKLEGYLAALNLPEAEETIYAADLLRAMDVKRVVRTRATEKSNSSHDLTSVLYDLWVQSKRVNVVGPEAHFSWEQLMGRGIDAPIVLNAKGMDPRDLALLKKILRSVQSASVTSTGATKRGSDSSKPAAKRQKSDPSKTPSRPDIESSDQKELTFDNETIERKKVAYQCANYGLHILSAGGFKDYSLGALICEDEIQLMYYDHSCIAISAPLNFRSNRRMFRLFQVCLFKTQQASLQNRGGIIGRLFENPSPYMRDYAKYQKVVDQDLRNIFVGQFITLQDANGSFSVKLGRIIHQEAGLIGRCTYIVNAESETRWPGMKLVVKITWSPTDRTSEATFVNRVREEAAAQNADWVLDHVPNILHSQDFERLPDEVGCDLAAFLNDPSTRYADGRRFTYENRVLRVSVHEKLCKLSEASSVVDYAQIFFDVLQVHRWIYDHARILHRDISQGNIMWHMRRGRICGVLNDFDLSSFRDSTSPSSKQRTGTRPFMAREFHTNPEAPPAHLYRHDLESLFYVLFVLVIANNLLKTPKYNDRVPGEKCLNVFSHYSRWLLEHDDPTLYSEKVKLFNVLQFPAPADNALEVLADRVSELHTALCAGFYAQDGHVKLAGYILDAQTLVQWAQRLTGNQYDSEDVDDVTQASIHVKALAYKKYGITMKVMGEEVTLEDMTIMVVTQSRDFPDGCVGYPEDKLPHFEEGAREARVLEVLTKEGFDPSKSRFGRKLTGQEKYW
ncbi:hypothetical protein CPB85DRAFT_1565245 [Mucidula mucida]|nr:hypothetical protein CPB85DRAFT_1565245 [Mucidula mucida]